MGRKHEEVNGKQEPTCIPDSFRTLGRRWCERGTRENHSANGSEQESDVKAAGLHLELQKNPQANITQSSLALITSRWLPGWVLETALGSSGQ